MNDGLETLLRNTFEDDAQAAPAAIGLAGGARTRLRRRRPSLGGTVAAVAAVVTVSALAIGDPGSTSNRGVPPGGGGGVVTVVPNPTSEYCAAAPTCDEKKQVDALRRPLHLPAVAAGGACPVSASHTMPAGGGFNSDYPAVGDGPFRLTGTGRLEIQDPPPAGDSYAGTGWPGMKVIWHIDPGYTGPVLLRGARVDGPGGLRFDHYLGAYGQGDEPTGYPELAYPGLDGGQVLRTYPSGVRVESGAGGCYAIQVDGTTFSKVIVFQATLVRP